MMRAENLFADLPVAGTAEVFDEILLSGRLRIERIVSRGHTAPESGWFDQEWDEWVLVLRGAAVLAYDDGREIELPPGGYVNLPAHTRHRVKWTDPACETVWLAVHYSASD